VVKDRIFAVLLAFLRGVLENAVFGDGILMVKSWWNVQKTWRMNVVARCLKLRHRFELYFQFRPADFV
jgi:hypothetical protein